MPPELPEKYYLDYFLYILDFVTIKYEDLLKEEEKDFILSLRNLEEDSLCLYIRLCMRRGIFFKEASLDYQDIQDYKRAIRVLETASFLSLPREQDLETDTILNVFNKKELLKLSKEKLASSLKKGDCVEAIFQQYEAKDLVAKIEANHPIYVQLRTDEMAWIFFLFFGTIHRDLSEFIVRDLGYRSFEVNDIALMTPYFKTRADALSKYLLSNLWLEFEAYKDLLESEALCAWSENVVQTIQPEGIQSQKTYDSFVLSLAKRLEKELPEKSLALYKNTTKPPSAERQVRLLKKLKRIEEAKELCHQIEAYSPYTKELYFARDFLNKLVDSKAIKSTSKALKSASSIQIDAAFKYSVEAGALAYYVEDGWEGFFSENHVWNTILVLLFWEIIFDKEQDAIHHPFQGLPSDWKDPIFVSKRKEQIEQHPVLGWDKNQLRDYLSEMYLAKYGKSNPLIIWHEDLFSYIEYYIHCLKKEQIISILFKMIYNLGQYTKGFPDLFIHKGKDYKFLEIKSPGDTLSSQQLYWLDYFKSQKINIEVIKVEWK